LLVAWLIQAGLQEAHFFDRYDESDADHYARTIWVPKEFSDHVVIVNVSEDDYRDLFDSRSPLDSVELIHLVQTLQSSRPRVIGVDFLTGDWHSRFPGAFARTSPPVVWARDGRPDAPSETAPELLPQLSEWNGVVGYSTPPAGLCFAPPVNQPDSDGAIRRYSTAITVRKPGSTATAIFPTMAHVLAASYFDRPFDCRGGADAAVKRIRFTGENHHFRVLAASDVLRDADNGRKLEKYLANRIVLLGGTFAGRDMFASGGQYLSGALILANAVESEISGPIHELPVWASLLVALGVSLLLYWRVSRLRSPLDVLAAFALLIAFSFIAGWFCYRYLAVFLPIASTLFSLPIGIIVEHHMSCSHGEN
jgi:CHASE2 domain-containing sensor protein